MESSLGFKLIGAVVIWALALVSHPRWFRSTTVVVPRRRLACKWINWKHPMVCDGKAPAQNSPKPAPKKKQVPGQTNPAMGVGVVIQETSVELKKWQNSSKASPFFIALKNTSTLRCKSSCPKKGPEVLHLYWQTAAPRWSQPGTVEAVEGSTDPAVLIHGASILPTSVSSFGMSPSNSYQLISNDPNNAEIRGFRPAARVVLASCLLPRNQSPRLSTHGKNPFLTKITCLNKSRSELRARLTGELGPCVYAQDYYNPSLFQHALINSVPTLGLASLVKRYLLPDVVLVGTDSSQSQITGETTGQHACTWKKWNSSNRCGLVSNDSTREWIFIGTGEPYATHDCYPVGSFDRFRREIVSSGLRNSERNLLIFASRDNGNGMGKRMPRKKDTQALELWLSRTLAPELGLHYMKTFFHSDENLIRSSFSRARLVFAPHGGALSNIAFVHESTLVVEFAPAHEKRFCFACMAYAMRFPAYAIFIPEGPGGWDKNINIDKPYILKISDLTKFWYNELASVFRAMQTMNASYVY
jgi:hypothetical protein